MRDLIGARTLAFATLATASAGIARAQPSPASPPPATGQVEVTLDASLAGSISIEPAFPVHIEYGMDFGFGAAGAELPIQGFAGVIGVPINVYITRWLGLGVRGQLVFGRDPGLDDPSTPGHVDEVETPGLRAWSATAGPRIRLWSDAAARLRWVIDVDAGWVHTASGLSPAGPLARLTLGREVGVFDMRGNGVNIGIALSAETGLGDAAPHRAVFGSVWFHGEGGAPVACRATTERLCSAPATARSDSWPPSTFTIDSTLFAGKNLGSAGTWGALGVLGVGVNYGIPATAMVEPRVRLDTMYLRHSGLDSTTMIAGAAGVRLRFDRMLPVFVDVMGGYERAYGTEPQPIGSGAFIDLAAGVHSVWCNGSADFGARLRLGVGPDNSKLATLALMVGGGPASRPGAAGLPRQRCP